MRLSWVEFGYLVVSVCSSVIQAIDEEMRIEDLGPVAAIEAFDIRVLIGLPG